MTDTWSDMQAFKSKHASLRERMKRRKEAVAGILQTDSVTSSSSSGINPETSTAAAGSETLVSQKVKDETAAVKPEESEITIEQMVETEKRLLLYLNDVTLDLPVQSGVLQESVNKQLTFTVPLKVIEDLLEKFAAQMLLNLSREASSEQKQATVTSVDHNKLSAFSEELTEKTKPVRRRKRVENENEGNVEKALAKHPKREDLHRKDDLIESLLSAKTAKETENHKVNEEIMELLSKPTAKEQSIVEKFRSQGGTSLQEFCPYGTRTECRKTNPAGRSCGRLHFKKIIHKHTDESLGDCSFLNTCFHMDTCKYVHYAVDYPDSSSKSSSSLLQQVAKKPTTTTSESSTVLFSSQWIQCDLRYFDMNVLGKFAVIMADPPWDIHMELPYGTMQDDEMRKLNVPALQDHGYIFLWVTGRAMELGRECLQVWGYERVDELIWVKTNQLQRIIRTGRTGHWLNHGKEHCLIGAKGDTRNFNRGLDCDILVAEVRATSHKPDEVYGIIERLSPGTRKIELFGRPHNTQPNWVTLGNQVDGVKLLEPDVVKAFRKKYPEPKMAMLAPDKAEIFYRTGKIE